MKYLVNTNKNSKWELIEGNSPKGVASCICSWYGYGTKILITDMSTTPKQAWLYEYTKEQQTDGTFLKELDTINV